MKINSQQNKKRVTLLLAILVIGIWGAFFVRIFNFSSPSHKVTYEATLPERIELKEKITVEKVRLSYNDPFGMVVTKKKKKRRAVVKKKEKPKKKKVRFPSIRYSGFVGSKQDIKFYVVTIKGAQYYLKLNQEEAELKLVDGNHKEITFLKEGELKSFSLAE